MEKSSSIYDPKQQRVFIMWHAKQLMGQVKVEHQQACT